ncbi:MAG TPA: tannase/feruloyl esterase family alpha/beta hydrolase [Bryobacteraceae bacterium]|nr:tannase/feruloyl esterase family alpha/beta hydrolase [Bryobacteraceae bacterium]
MKTLVLLIATGCWSLAFAADCESLASLKLRDATITSAHTVAAGAFTPAEGPQNGPYKTMPSFCRVQGVSKPSADSQIEFEVWMPASGWNGKYFGIGNGGFAGSIQYSLMAAALHGGYASSSTDTGHKGPATNADWALGHYEKIVDFAYRSIHETAEKSKSVIQGFYGRNPKHSYFSGCSNGGRQALVEAQRYPADYDGIIAGAAANFWTHNFAGFIWDEQALDGAAQIPPSKMPAIERAALAACDARDGVEDGVIDDPTKCHFDPATLLCHGADSESCLTAGQVGALKKIYEGPRNSKGEQIFPGYLPGAESGPGGWSRWIAGPDAQQVVFGNGFFANMVFQNAKWDFRSFNFDRDMKITDDKSARLFNATDANLKAFKNGGGKLLMYHGWSDTAIAPVNAVIYYESVVKEMGPKQAGEFTQLYMVPGMQHCAGGPGPNSFGTNPSATPSDPRHSMALALDRWVDQGVAPSQIIATKFKTGANPESGVVRTRPLCPYPQVAHYVGSGSTDDAANFKCAVPPSK